jgi:2'-hydroxyisoflavone reductase
VRLVEDGVTGVYSACSTDPGWTFGEMVEQMAAVVAPAGTRLRWVDGDWLRGQGVRESDLPLWAEGGHDQSLALDPSAARRTGLRARPVEETIVETWRWMSAGDALRPGAARLSPQREAALLRASG